MPDPALKQEVDAALTGRYRLGRELVRGPHSVTFLGEDLRHGRPVTVLVMELSDISPAEADRLRQELAAITQLHHPHILPPLESGRTARTLFLVTQSIEGELLADVLRDHRVLALGDVLRLLASLADVVSYAHQRGVGRLTFSPATVLLSGRHTMVRPAVEPRSPEGGQTDADTGVRALGLLAYQLLTGTSASDSEAPDLDQVRPELPPPVREVLERCVTPLPENRWPDGEALLAAVEPLLTPSASTPVATSPLRNVRRAGLSLVGIGLAIAIGAFAVTRAMPSWHRPAETSFQRLSFQGNVQEAAISPDGRTVAYVVNSDTARLLVQDVAASEPREVARAKRIMSLIWSGDGTSLSFTAMEREGARLRVVSRTGDQLRTLPISGGVGIQSPDGKRLAVYRIGSRNLELVQLEASDTTRIDLTGSYTWNFGFAWSPQQDRIAFGFTLPEEGRYGLRVTTTDGRVQEEVVRDSSWFSNPVWSSDGKALYCVRWPAGRLRSGNAQLVEIPMNGTRAGTPVVRASFPFGIQLNISTVMLSRAGDRFAVVSSAQSSNIGRLSPLSSGKPSISFYTAGTALHLGARISPDGHEFAVVRGEYIASELVVQSMTGDQKPVVIGQTQAAYQVAWSPEGQRLAVAGTDSLGRRYIHVFRRSGGTLGRYSHGLVSGSLTWLDSTHIMYQGRGNRELGVLDLATGRDSTVPGVTDGWVFYLVGSPAHSTAAFVWSGRAGKVSTWQVTLGDSSRTMLRPGYGIPLRWSADGRGLYLTDGGLEREHIALLYLPVGSQRAESLLVIPDGYQPEDITPDGQTLLISQSETRSEVWLLTLHR